MTTAVMMPRKLITFLVPSKIPSNSWSVRAVSFAQHFLSQLGPQHSVKWEGSPVRETVHKSQSMGILSTIRSFIYS